MQRIAVSLTRQDLCLIDGDKTVARYLVSTSRFGPGQRRDSQCTPTGRHRIRARIGEGLPAGSVLVGRRPTGEIYTADLARQYPRRDWILSRILWLCGCEPGHNRFGDVDSMQRFIYIHGTPDSEPIGVPLSHGCVRMRNADVMQLFDRVQTGTVVDVLD